MDRNNIIISEVGDMLGLPLNFDEEGICALQFDDTLLVSLQVWENDSWLLTGILSESLPAEMGEAFWKKVLSCNGELAWKHAGSIVYSDESGSLLLTDTITELSNVHAIVAHLELFVNSQEYLIRELQRE